MEHVAALQASHAELNAGMILEFLMNYDCLFVNLFVYKFVCQYRLLQASHAEFKAGDHPFKMSANFQDF